MAFWKRKTNWDDEYDEYYAQDRGIHRRRPRPGLSILFHVTLLAVAGGLFLLGVGLVGGPRMVEKWLTAMANPLGVTWLGLILLIYVSLLNRRGWTATIGLGLWVVLTAGGNQLVSHWLVHSLETPYQDINPYVDSGEPFEWVVVLGGATQTNLAGNAQLGINGDRLAVAARMYHAGRVQGLICTGSASSPTGRTRHPREESVEILNGLGVPSKALLQMQGINTSEEMANLRRWLDENPPQGRVGVLTSAWHLPRVMRLAKANGVEVEPLPANFLSGPFKPSPQLVIPGSYQLLVTNKMCKEYLARWVGR